MELKTILSKFTKGKDSVPLQVLKPIPIHTDTRIPERQVQIGKDAYLSRFDGENRSNVEGVISTFERLTPPDSPVRKYLLGVGGTVDPKKPMPRKDTDIALLVEPSDEHNGSNGLQRAEAAYRNVSELADAILADHPDKFAGREDKPPYPDPEHPTIQAHDGTVKLVPIQPTDPFEQPPMPIELISEPVYDSIDDQLEKRKTTGKLYVVLSRTF